MGHDTATTDKEEAVEALLALSNLPDMDDEGNGSDDNVNLMPIDGPSSSIDVNPVKVKLGADDINQAIEQLTMESRLEVAPQTTQDDARENSTETDPQPTAHQENSPLNSPTKGTLKVKNYGLKKSRQSNRIYRCQKCGCKCHGMTKSVRKTNRLTKILFLLFWPVLCVSLISLIEI